MKRITQRNQRKVTSQSYACVLLIFISLHVLLFFEMFLLLFLYINGVVESPLVLAEISDKYGILLHKNMDFKSRWKIIITKITVRDGKKYISIIYIYIIINTYNYNHFVNPSALVDLKIVVWFKSLIKKFSTFLKFFLLMYIHILNPSIIL